MNLTGLSNYSYTQEVELDTKEWDDPACPAVSKKRFQDSAGEIVIFTNMHSKKNSVHIKSEGALHSCA